MRIRGIWGITMNNNEITYAEIRSLNRSSVKRRILRYLKRLNGKITILGLSREIGSNFSNTYYAIFGDGLKYAFEGALITMAMIDIEYSKDGSILCNIIMKGIAAIDFITE
ncbi:archaellum operon transcriptional activator EarA family protein [Methanocella sp. MCL-LM]|uniref:archaellum operon transcriptional activator EarA family protein n=1 Tax=Methanocella sp. MCL-LM TaxID=3412035 RepID=UPI003C73E98F